MCAEQSFVELCEEKRASLGDLTDAANVSVIGLLYSVYCIDFVSFHCFATSFSQKVTASSAECRCSSPPHRISLSGILARCASCLDLTILAFVS